MSRVNSSLWARRQPARFLAAWLLCGAAAWPDEPAAAPAEAAAADSIQDIFFLTPQKPLLIRLRVYVNGAGFRALRQTWADAQFAALDADHNGFLEGDEIKKLPPPGVLRIDGAMDASQAVPADSDPQDGKVSPEECRRYLVMTSGTPFSIQSLNNQQQVVFVNGRQSVQVNLFPKIDTDLDGKLSKQEIEVAAERLRRYDRNEDDVVDNAELQQSLPEEQLTSQQQLAGVLSQLLVVDNYDGVATSRRLLESYDKAARDPAARLFRKDEKLVRTEIPISNEKFALADRNQDGKLDRKELGRLSSVLDPDVEVEIQAPAAEGKFAVKSLRAVDPTIASQLNLQVNSSNILVLTLNDTELALSAAGPPSGSEKQLRDRYLQQFMFMDQDKNDYLERMEMQRFGFPESFFTLADADNDGKVFEPEYKTLIDRQIELSRSSLAMEVSSDGRSLFRLIDTSPSDGRLSLRELSEAAKKFAAWDANGDGNITLSELSIQLDAVFRAGTPRINGPFPVQIEAVSPAGSQQPAANQPQLPSWFLKMDRNRDGDLSPKEFLARKMLFDQIDKNHDGLISAEEAVKAQNAAAATKP